MALFCRWPCKTTLTQGVSVATLYPRLSDNELDTLPSRAEAKVYRWLRELDFPGLQVMHGLATQTQNDKGTWVGEIDFLLFHPQYGIQVWEVKGGGIRLDGEGQWWSEGNHGNIKLSTTPLDQLKKQTNSLLQVMQKVTPGIRLPMAPVMVFPDTRAWEGQLPELTLNRDHLLLKGELERLDAEAITRRFGNAAWAGPRADNSLPLSKQQANLIQHHLLRPACALMTSIAERSRDIDAELFRLSEEQQWVLRLLEHIPRMAIHGGAGTGKSLLARAQAEQLAREGEKVLMLCYNIALAEAHRQALAESGLESIEVATFHELCESRSRRAGLSWEPPSDTKALGVFYNETAPNLLVEALQQNPEQWAALVVDEAQDYEPYWWLVLQELLAEQARVTLFADPAQNLYSREYQIPSDVFTGMVPYPFTLHRNYRNAYEIAAWLKQRHSAAAEPGEHLPSSENAVQVLEWRSQEEQTTLLTQAISGLEENGFTPEDILLLTPFKVAKSQVLQALADEKPAYAERMFNVSAVKGLEAPVVILLNIGASEWASNPLIEYVGASRAKLKICLLKKHGSRRTF
ncbi:AAA family ATPase [Halomonas sp. Bachu 37]|uniref:nuclease-related domain-containing DEAD/DEAH box helicase n=1 Tax=Halomonas kashgarensis TaxID=3084920 RepID=UPI003217BB33